ncbi:hypothetical protein ACVWWO_004511 [Bradyrhizobium sp. F1.13.1]
MARRLPVEGAVIGGEQILRERQLRGDTLQLAPEAAPHALTIFREPVGRLETDAVFGSHVRTNSPFQPGVADRRIPC